MESIEAEFVADVSRLVRARQLLAATLDDHRAVVGRVSRAWIRKEIERRVRWGSLSESVRRHPAVSREAGGFDSDDLVNTNWLPKLEPWINANILVGAMLYGTRLYGEGTEDPSRGVDCSEIENDLIVAAMVHETLDLPDRFSALLPDDWRTVDEAYLRERFGARVAEHVGALRGHLQEFERALRTGKQDELRIPFPYANAIAAITAANLRLTARAAGDAIFGLFDEEQRGELRQRGFDVGDPNAGFPERPYLERDYARARAAIALDGVDVSTLRSPVEGQLLQSVSNVLERGLPRDQLVGRYGAAVYQFHMVLPLMYRYSPINRRTAVGPDGAQAEVEGPFALATLHVTGLEAARYLHKVRRKGNGTAAAHSFVVAARAESVLHSRRGIPVIAGSDCHDLVEDGGIEVTGYDQSLEMVASRFGAPLAALVSEVTDSITKADGPAKAATFRKEPQLSFPEQLYNRGQFDELRAVATDPHVPYTVSGAVIKLADTGTTQDEGIRDPDMMSGIWRHSGARVNWDLYGKGRIVGPLVERLVIEIRVSETDPFYHRKRGGLPRPLVRRLKELIGWFFETSDRYMVQNLIILAEEYGLDESGCKKLVDLFFNDEGEREEIGSLLDRLLDDARLDSGVAERGLPATYRVRRGGRSQRDLGKLLDYREAARARRAVRELLGLEAPHRDDFEDVVRLYDLRMGRTSRPVV
jgi:hypothetical protein